MRKIFISAMMVISFFSSVYGTESADGVLQLTDKLTGIVPEPQQVFIFKNRTAPFAISDATVIVVNKPASELVMRAAKLLQADISSLYRLDVKIIERSSPLGLLMCNDLLANESIVREMQTISSGVRVQGDEGYRLISRAEGVWVNANASAGVFNGVQTLRQMLRSDGQVPAMAINDWPDQKIRATYLGYPVDQKAIVEKMARLKINMCIVESKWYAGGNWWYNPTGKNREEAEAFIKLCWENNIEPVPLVQGLGWAYGVVDLNPNCSEGVWVKNEVHTLRGNQPDALMNPNVIRTQVAPIVVTNAEKTVMYVEDKDYRILPGQTIRPFRGSNIRWKIERLNGGHIAEGQQVLVSYNHATESPSQSPYCPSEPMTYKIVDNTLKTMIDLYHPKYIHIGHDEVIYSNRCSRCLGRKLPTSQLLGQDIQHWCKTLQQYDPQIKIMMWDDLLRENHSGGSLLSSVPQDVIICPWTYGNTPKEIQDRERWFLGKNKRLTMGVSSGYDHENIWLWKEAAAKYRNSSTNMGFMFSHWGESPVLWSALPFAAEYMWSSGKPGKSVFDLYVQADRIARSIGAGITLNVNDQKEAFVTQINNDVLAGRNPQIKVDEVCLAFKKIESSLMNRMVTDLVTVPTASGTVPEHIMTQMDVFTEYFQSLSDYVQAQTLFGKGEKEKAFDLIGKIVEAMKRQYLNGWVQAENVYHESQATGRFPSSQDLLGVDLKVLSPYGGQGVGCLLNNLDLMIKEKTTTSRIYDLGTARNICRLELEGAGKGDVTVDGCVDGRRYEQVGKTTRETNSLGTETIIWAPRLIRYLRVSWNKSHHDIKVKMYVSKDIAEYTCIFKPGVNWSQENFWAGIPRAENFVLKDGSIAPRQTVAQAVYDEKNLYVRFLCDILPDQKLLARPETSGIPIWEDDCVQLFLARKGDKGHFYQILVNSQGRYLLMEHGGKASSVQIKTVVSRNGSQWKTLMAIPLSCFGKESLASSTKWKINFCRNQSDPCDLSSWSILPRDAAFWFLQPEFFGTLKMGTK